MDLAVNGTTCLIIQFLFGNTSQFDVCTVAWKSIIKRQVTLIVIDIKFGILGKIRTNMSGADKWPR